MTRGFIDREWQDGEVRGRLFLAGEAGMGKTTEMSRLMWQCTGAEIFFDTVGDHWQEYVAKGFTKLQQPRDLKRYLIHNRGRRARVVYVPPDEFADQHLSSICQIVRAIAKELFGGMVLGIDEIDMCAGKGPNGMSPSLYYLVQCGRHVPMSLICTARDPATLPIRFRSQCTEMRIFRTSEQRYVDYFAARIGKVNASALSTLQETYYLHWQAGSLDAPIKGGPRKL
jgi:hypothetical protein